MEGKSVFRVYCRKKCIFNRNKEENFRQPACVPSAHRSWAALQLSEHISYREASDLQGVPRLGRALVQGHHHLGSCDKVASSAREASGLQGFLQLEGALVEVTTILDLVRKQPAQSGSQRTPE